MPEQEPGGDWAPRSGPLVGLRVLDLSRVLSGPYCTMSLGDLGAEVIKVERPGSGDDTRRWGPPFVAGESTYFLSANRNKRSLVLDLATPAGREVALALARRADVLVENFRPGIAARLGLGWERLSRENPRLIYCSISGYGQTGPDRERPGYDAVAQAESGMMAITGEPEGQPMKHGASIADLTAGLWALAAILAALYRREQDGLGQYIDVALLDGQLSMLTYIAQAYLVTGREPGRYGSAHASIVPYQPLATRDGQLMVAVGNDRLFARLARALGHPEWLEDPIMATDRARLDHRREVVARLEAVTRGQDTAYWQKVLEEAGVPSGPIRKVSEALRHPQAAAREMVQRVHHPAVGELELLGVVPKFSRTPGAVRRPPPLLGEHQAEILAELGLSPQEVRALAEAGAFGPPPEQAGSAPEPANPRGTGSKPGSGSGHG